MISENEKQILIDGAKKYKIGSVYIFGSSVLNDDYRDIDIAVKNINPDVFFKFYGELMLQMPKPVDVINLDNENAFTRIIEEEAFRIYG
jgi:predicted nucleotidyltransferase